MHYFMLPFMHFSLYWNGSCSVQCILWIMKCVFYVPVHNRISFVYWPDIDIFLLLFIPIHIFLKPYLLWRGWDHFRGHHSHCHVRIFYPQENKEPSPGHFSTGSTLGVELCKIHRRLSGNLQLPPLSWRQAERDRDRVMSLTTEEDPVTCTRPTSLDIVSLPRIDITKADPDR